jgi:four helix bundle protein
VESEKSNFESEDNVWEVESGRSDFESGGSAGSKPQDLKARTQAFALRVIRMVQALPRNRVADVIGKQVLRSATTVGANYRSACRGRSKPDFISKLGIAEEEADETCYWLELRFRARSSPK